MKVIKTKVQLAFSLPEFGLPELDASARSSSVGDSTGLLTSGSGSTYPSISSVNRFNWSFWQGCLGALSILLISLILSRRSLASFSANADGGWGSGRCALVTSIEWLLVVSPGAVTGCWPLTEASCAFFLSICVTCWLYEKGWLPWKESPRTSSVALSIFERTEGKPVEAGPH